MAAAKKGKKTSKPKKSSKSKKKSGNSDFFTKFMLILLVLALLAAAVFLTLSDFNIDNDKKEDAKTETVVKKDNKTDVKKEKSVSKESNKTDKTEAKKEKSVSKEPNKTETKKEKVTPKESNKKEVKKEASTPKKQKEETNNTKKEVKESKTLEGCWHSTEQGAFITIDQFGYRIDFSNVDATKPLTGNYSIENNLIIFTSDDNECNGVEGTYRITFYKKNISLICKDDDCTSRRNILETDWEWIEY